MSKYEKIELTFVTTTVMLWFKIKSTNLGAALLFPADILKSRNLLLIPSSEKLKKKQVLSLKALNYAA